jgi:diguanylate cyclase (GGDEF)-like protein/PAS domain S-box-containing protein
VHALLHRQLERILGRAIDGDAAAGADVSLDAAQAAALVELVSRTYEAFERARAAVEPSAVEVALRASEERYQLALRGSNDGIWDWSAPERFVHVSARACAILGEPARDGRLGLLAFYRRIHPDDRDLVRQLIDAHLADEHALLQVECRMRHDDDDWRWILLRGAAVRDDDGRVRRLAGSLSDVTVRKEAEAELLRASVHDRLTGLPNRGYFLDALQRVLARSRRRPDVRFAVAFLDLDRLKLVNDTLGHQAGDVLLAECARRIAGVVRNVDMVARLSGDEFALLLDELATPAEALIVADRISAALVKPLDIHGHLVQPSASIGVVLSDPAYETAEQMLRDADVAMYRAKARGRGGYALFDREMLERANERLALEADLEHAVERGELRVHYQPIVKLSTLEPVGCEALARWFHPTRGMLSPGEFMSIAEESGEAHALGRFVLREVCRDAAGLAEQVDGPLPLYVTVNVSPSQLLESDLADFVGRTLADFGLAPEQLGLEVSETALLTLPAAAEATLARLRAMRVRVHLDDFGTGHSSLSYLHRMEVDQIKIDRSFVAHPDGDARAGEGGVSDGEPVFNSIVNIARRLGKLSVAEGIETESELALCRRLGCDLGQGYLFARPMDVEATTRWLKKAAGRGRRRKKRADETPRVS